MTATYTLNDKEFESILRLQGAKRYEHLVSRVSDWEAVWGLRGDDGWCAAADGDGHSAFPIWPHPRYAQRCAVDDWRDAASAAPIRSMGSARTKATRHRFPIFISAATASPRSITKDSVGKDFSRFGFELTFRLASQGEERDELVWVCNLIQNLARYVFESGRWFEEHHWIPANGPIKLDTDTDMVGLIFVRDPELPPTDTPHGRVEFL